MRALFVMLLLLWGVLGTAIVLLGCHRQDADHPEEGVGATIGAGGSGGSVTCDDACDPPPEGWSGPSLFAWGTYSEVPPCPEVGGIPLEPGLEAYDGLQPAPPACQVCQCGSSETTCGVPVDWHASAAPCAGAEAAEATSFSASPGWPGTCTEEGAIVAGALCNGVPCVQSVTVAAPTITAGSCPPEELTKAIFPPAVWTTRARECLPDEPGACPVEPPACRLPPGFALCIHRDGDVACHDPYTDKHRFFRDTDDSRTCSPCGCGPPEDNACLVFVKAYSDATCATIAGAINVASGMDGGCFDVPAGFPLGSKTAEVAALQPGSCASTGGLPYGALTAAQPVTVCCKEEVVAK